MTLETAWNTPASTTEGYETVGKQLGLAIARYLQPSPRIGLKGQNMPAQANASTASGGLGYQGSPN